MKELLEKIKELQQRISTTRRLSRTIPRQAREVWDFAHDAVRVGAQL